MAEYAIAPSALQLGVFNDRECSELTPEQWLSNQDVQGVIVAAHLPYDVSDGDDIWLSRKLWNQHHDGLVIFVALPRGGGDKGGSNPLMLVATLAVAAFAPWAAGAILGTTSGFAYTALAAGIGIVGQSLVSKAFGTPPAPSNAALPASSPTYSNQVRGNQARLNESIPVQYGEVTFPPDFIQSPYVRFHHNDEDEYLYCLYCLGQGSFVVDEAGFGLGIDLPLQELDGVTLQLINDNYYPRRNPDYYPLPELSDALSPMGSLSHDVRIMSSCSYVARDVSNFNLEDTKWTRWFMPVPRFAGANELMFNLLVPGLYYAEDDGGLSTRTVTIKFQAQRIDNEGNEIESVLDLSYSITASTVNTIRRTRLVRVPYGRWKVRARRVEEVSTDQRLNNKSMIHSIVAHDTLAKLQSNCTYLALKIKATGQLSSSMNSQFYVKARRKLPRLDSAGLLTVDPDRWDYNRPQVAVADMLRADYGLNAGGAVDSEAHLAYLPDLSEYSGMESANAFPAQSNFNFRFDSPTPLMDAISLAVKPLMATPYIMGGQIYFAMAKRNDQIAQRVIEGVESYTESVSMPRGLQSTAVEVEYWDSRYNRLTTILCKTSEPTPKLVDKLNVYGINNAHDAYCQGMKYLLSAKVQTHDISYETDIRGRVPMPMDRVVLGFVDEMEAQTGYITDVGVEGDSVKVQLSDDPLIDYSRDGVAAYMRVRTASGQSMHFDIMATDEPDAICEIRLSLRQENANLLVGLRDQCFGVHESALQYAITQADHIDDRTQYIGQGTLVRVMSVEPGSEGKVKVSTVKDTPLLYQDIGFAPESINPYQLAALSIWRTAPVLRATVMPESGADGQSPRVRVSWQHQNGANAYRVQVYIGGSSNSGWGYDREVTANECWFDTSLFNDYQGNPIDTENFKVSVQGVDIDLGMPNATRTYGSRNTRTFNLIQL